MPPSLTPSYLRPTHCITAAGMSLRIVARLVLPPQQHHHHAVDPSGPSRLAEPEHFWLDVPHVRQPSGFSVSGAVRTLSRTAAGVLPRPESLSGTWPALARPPSAAAAVRGGGGSGVAPGSTQWYQQLRKPQAMHCSFTAATLPALQAQSSGAKSFTAGHRIVPLNAVLWSPSVHGGNAFSGNAAGPAALQAAAGLASVPGGPQAAVPARRPAQPALQADGSLRGRPGSPRDSRDGRCQDLPAASSMSHTEPSATHVRSLRSSTWSPHHWADAVGQKGGSGVDGGAPQSPAGNSEQHAGPGLEAVAVALHTRLQGSRSRKVRAAPGGGAAVPGSPPPVVLKRLRFDSQPGQQQQQACSDDHDSTASSGVAHGELGHSNSGSPPLGGKAVSGPLLTWAVPTSRLRPMSAGTAQHQATPAGPSPPGSSRPDRPALRGTTWHSLPLHANAPSSGSHAGTARGAVLQRAVAADGPVRSSHSVTSIYHGAQHSMDGSLGGAVRGQPQSLWMAPMPTRSASQTSLMVRRGRAVTESELRWDSVGGTAPGEEQLASRFKSFSNALFSTSGSGAVGGQAGQAGRMAASSSGAVGVRAQQQQGADGLLAAAGSSQSGRRAAPAAGPVAEGLEDNVGAAGEQSVSVHCACPARAARAAMSTRNLRLGHCFRSRCQEATPELLRSN